MNIFRLVLQLDPRDFLGGCGALARSGGDDETRFVEQRDAGGPVVDFQKGADDEAGLAAGQQVFAVDVQAGSEGPGLGLMIQRPHVGKSAELQHQRLLAGVGAVRKQDDTIRAGRIFLASEPHRSRSLRSARLVKHADLVAVGRHRGGHLEPALLDQRAAAAPVADQLDDPRAAALQLGELQRAGDAAEGGLLVLDREFARGGQAVEIEIEPGAHQVFAAVVDEVDLVHLDQQRGDVLDVDREGDRLVRREEPRVGGQEVDVHPAAQRGELAGGEGGGEGFRIALAGEDARGGVRGAEPALLEVGREGRGGCGFGEKMAEEVEDEGLAGARGRQAARGDVVAQAHQLLVRGRLAHGGMEPGHVAGDLEVLGEEGEVGFALGAVEVEQVVEYAGLEVVEGGAEAGGEGVEAFEPGAADGGVEVGIVIRAGGEAREACGDVQLVFQQGGDFLRELFELCEGESAVGLERSEAAAVFVLEVGGDEVKEAGIGGVVDASEQFAAHARVEFGGVELVEAFVLHGGEIAGTQGDAEEAGGVGEVRGEPVGGGGAGVLGVRGVAEEEAEAADQVVGGGLGILRVIEQRLPEGDLVGQRVVGVAVAEGGERFGHAFRIALELLVQRGVEIRFGRTRHEQREGVFPRGRIGEGFPEFKGDLRTGEQQGGGKDGQQDRQTHGKPPGGQDNAEGDDSED